MDLNVAVPPANELFEDNDMVFPILMGRENLKILASPGSESSGVSSLDAEEAKKLANEQLPTSSSPTLASEPSSAVQTESESCDGSSDGDDDKPIEQSSGESVQSADESEQQSTASDDDDDNEDDDIVNDDNDDEDKANVTAIKVAIENDDGDLTITNGQTELVPSAAAQDDDKASIDLDEIRYKNLKLFYEGRDILDFGANVANKSWNVKYAHLPEQNYQMYIQNRSQYNRLAPGYESPEHYALNACGRCAFQFPVMVDIQDEAEQAATSACKSSVNELLTQTVSSIVNALAQKLPPAQPMAQSSSASASSMHTLTGQSMNNLNNFMLNNNAATPAQSYAYQNRNQFLNNGANIAAAAANNNNHSCFKQNNGNNMSTNSNNTNNAFYGNNPVLNALVNQIGNNMNNSSAFNSNFMNTINGTNTTNPMNQLSNAALANLMNQNRQLYGMCRQNINKSGINFNASSHKQMPTYSHF